MATADSNPFDTQTAEDALTAASECVGLAAAQRFKRFSWTTDALVESPIEAVFWVWWRALHYIDELLRVGHSIRLQPQFELLVSDGSRFRLDFAVEEYKVAIELDGHDFHERTKEQVAHRNMRDRKLQADGWTVMHISGSEIYRDPFNSVAEVYNFCCDKEDAVWRAEIQRTIEAMPPSVQVP